MGTYLFKGTSNYASDGVTNASNSYDGATTYGDKSTYSYASSTSAARAMAVYGCNNSEVLNLVNSGRKIKTLIFHVIARKHGSSTPSTAKISARCVHSISGINTYTDAGDGSLALASSMTTTPTEYTVSFQSAVNYFNSNPTKFSKICGRFYGWYWRIYDMWWEIEFEEVKVDKHIFDVIDKTVKVDDSYYLSPDSYQYKKLLPVITDDEQIYRFSDYGIQTSKDGICFTLKANMGTWYNRVPIIKDNYGIRKATPYECLALQGFPKDFRFPKIPMASAYKQCGNSVVVPVIRRIAEEIKKVL